MWILCKYYAYTVVLVLYVQHAASLVLFIYMREVYQDEKYIFSPEKKYRVTYNGHLGCSNLQIEGCTLHMKVNPIYERIKYKVCAEMLEYNVIDTTYLLELYVNDSAPKKTYFSTFNSNDRNKVRNICGLSGEWLNITMKSSNPAFGYSRVILFIKAVETHTEDTRVRIDTGDSHWKNTQEDLLPSDMSEAETAGICFAVVAILFAIGGIYKYYRRKQHSLSSTNDSQETNVLTQQQQRPLVLNVLTPPTDIQNNMERNDGDSRPCSEARRCQPRSEYSSPHFIDQGSERPERAPPPSYEEVMSDHHAIF